MGLVFDETVYLDIDDVYVYDYYGKGHRLVCVVYVDYNSTHYLNVNEALLDAGLAEITEFPNEFNVNTWNLYVPKANVIPEFPAAETFAAAVIVVIPFIFLLKRVQKRCVTKQRTNIFGSLKIH